MRGISPSRGTRRGRVAAGAAGVAAVLAAVLIAGQLAGSDGDAVVDAAPVDAAPPDSVEAKPPVDPELAAALERWADFPVEADPRPIVLIQDTVGPGGFRTGEQKIGYGSGNWTAPEDLPESPATADGYPVISAREALDVLRNADGGGDATPQGDALEVTDMRLGSVEARTDRGEMRLPAWRVTFTGSTGPTWVPAVAPPARHELPARTELSGPSATTSAGDRRLTVHFSGSEEGPGPCGADYAIEVAESAHAVAFRIDTVARPEAMSAEPVDCAAALYGRTLTTRLAEPIGNRVLLSTDSADDVRGPLPVTVRR